jgi:hypothetical protein
MTDRIWSNMVEVKGGIFKMGATPEQKGDAGDRSNPVHSVKLNTFWICRYPVTQWAPQKILIDLQGYLQIEGYEAYEKFDEVAGITLVGCLAHARRKFFEASVSDKALADVALALYGEVYAVEKHIRELGTHRTRETRLASGTSTARIVSLAHLDDREIR